MEESRAERLQRLLIKAFPPFEEHIKSSAWDKLPQPENAQQTAALYAFDEVNGRPRLRFFNHASGEVLGVILDAPAGRDSQAKLLDKMEARLS